MHYPAAIHKDPTSDYGVSFPDLPGCVTAGETIDEALSMAVEAAELFIEVSLERGDPLPQPSTVEQFIDNPAYSDVLLWSIVTVDLSNLSDRSKRINITVPERLLKIIDAQAAIQNQSRSAFLVAAAMEKVTPIN